MRDNQITNLLIEEIRENRRAINELRIVIAKLDKDIFSNKVKLGLIIAGISLISSIIVVIVAEKAKTFI